MSFVIPSASKITLSFDLLFSFELVDHATNLQIFQSLLVSNSKIRTTSLLGILETAPFFFSLDLSSDTP